MQYLFDIKKIKQKNYFKNLILFRKALKGYILKTSRVVNGAKHTNE